MIRDRGTRGVGGLKNIEINGVRGLGRSLEVRGKGIIVEEWGRWEYGRDKEGG